MPAKRKAYPSASSSATIGFEAKLWLAADSRSTAETAEGIRSNNMANGSKLSEISINGQDKWARRNRSFGLAKRARSVRLRRKQPKQSNTTTLRLAIMNLAIRGIEADIGKEHADTFSNVQHPDLRAD